MKTIDAEYAKLRRESLPQPGQSGLEAAVGAMERSASPEQQLLRQHKVTTGITQSRVETAYHDAKVLGGLLGGLLRKVNKACFEARNFEAEVKELLRPTPPPFVLAAARGRASSQASALLAQRRSYAAAAAGAMAGSGPPSSEDGQLKATLQTKSTGGGGDSAAEPAMTAEEKAARQKIGAASQEAALDALVARREALTAQEEQCKALRAGAETIAAARAAAAATVERAKAQQAERAAASEGLQATFEALAKDLADLQAGADAIFGAELRSYGEFSTAKQSADATEAADAGHQLWMGWRKDLDHEFAKLRKFLKLRHGQLASTAEGHAETKTPPHAAFRKTEPPDGALCRSPAELQAELDKLDAQIDDVTAASFS